MTMQAAIAEKPAVAPAMTAERARALAERHLVVLEELMEEGLVLAKAIARQGIELDAPKVVEGNAGLEFDRAARAVRRSVALRDRLIADMLSEGKVESPEQKCIRVVFVDPDGTERPRPDFGAPQAAAEAPSPVPPVDPRARKAEVLSAVRAVAAAGLLPGEFSPREASDLVERRVGEAAERLETRLREDEREFDDFLRLPVSEAIDRICRDLGLFPDWERLADEAWARSEIDSGRVGRPLAPFSSPASGGGGPRSGGGGAGSPSAPSVTAPRAAPPPPRAGEESGPGP